MRFILLSIALFGLVLYISNPEAFGKKREFKLSVGGRIVREEPKGATIDFAKIGDFGVEMYESFFDSPDDSASNDTIVLAGNDQTSAPNGPETQILSAISAPDITTYSGQVSAISFAMHADPVGTTTQMQAAMKACLPHQYPEPLTNYFVGLVQVVSETAQLPLAEQTANFREESAPLTQALRAWLQFLPEDQRAENTLLLQDWAARPKDLVACHISWLSTP
ncbi:MAG: hypothetical protein COB08_010365 [Rhodobacteraceae bacterium]|nr:hypothetical protein [Paracoccaceae bacterium]